MQTQFVVVEFVRWMYGTKRKTDKAKLQDSMTARLQDCKTTI